VFVANLGEKYVLLTEEFAKALKEPTVNGLFNDLLYFLLTSIFNMQEQEENEEEQDITSDDTNMKSTSLHSNHTSVHFHSTIHIIALNFPP